MFHNLVQLFWLWNICARPCTEFAQVKDYRFLNHLTFRYLIRLPRWPREKTCPPSSWCWLEMEALVGCETPRATWTSDCPSLWANATKVPAPIFSKFFARFLVTAAVFLQERPPLWSVTWLASLRRSMWQPLEWRWVPFLLIHRFLYLFVILDCVMT